MSNQRTKWTEQQFNDWQARQSAPHIIGHATGKSVFRDGAHHAEVLIGSPRIRQSKKSLLNKLETRFHDHLRLVLHPGATIWPQAWSCRLGNGANYRPDFLTLTNDGRMVAHECKGPRGVYGASKGLFTLKIAASLYPQIEFFLVERIGGDWRITKVLP